MTFLKYAVARFFTMLLTLWVVSILVFIIINLPPGDYLSNQIAELRATGQAEGVAKAEFLRTEYALDRPIWEQYLIWVGFAPGPNGFSGLIQGDFGCSTKFKTTVAAQLFPALSATGILMFWVMVTMVPIALLIGILAHLMPAAPLIKSGGWSILLGILLFSGSLYALVLTGIKPLGIITPFGGVAFLIGWLLIAIAAWRHTS